MPNLPTGKRKHDPSRKPQARRIRTEDDKFYHTVAWRAVRKRYITLNPICEQCKKRGRITPGRVVDHITPIKQGGDKLNYSNLQTLCDSCHAIKSGREAHG